MSRSSIGAVVSTRNVVEKETELDANKRLALEIRTQIEGASIEDRKKRLNDVYNKWVIESKPQSNSIFSTLERALQNYGLTAEGLRIGHFEKATKLVLFEITYLYLFMSQKNSVEDQQEDTELVEEDAEYKEIKMKFNKIFSTITDAENAVRNSLFLQNSMMEEEFSISENDNGLYRFTPIDYSTNSPYQNLLLYLLERLMKKGYRRYNDECYKPIYTETGFNTHAWECAMSIRNFIHEVTKKEINFNMWKNLTSSKDNVKSAEKYLTEYIGGEFEDLTKDRHVFSFRNGIYIIKKSQVVQKITEDGRTEEEFIWYDEFIPFEGPNAKAIGASVVAAKYFDLEFDDCTEMTKKYDWFNIIRKHCPNFKGIMDYQEWPEETQKWLCILIGRNMYNLGEIEEWQILGYLLGQGASGKSTILTKIVKQIYESCDIGVLSNNIERKFGLSALADKFMFIGPEIKGDLSLEQSEFQSIISGEDVQVAEKHKVAKSIVWTVPGMLSGNEVPQYSDNAGSISRRLMVFKFDNKVKKGDTTLGHKLKAEIPYIIQAAAKGYLDAVNRYGSADIWDIVPEYFKKTKDDMAENTNALMHFLKSDAVRILPKCYVRSKVFVSAFNDHCKENNLGTVKWCNDYYLGPFSCFGIKTQRDCRRRYPNVPGARSYHGVFIFGVDIASDFDPGDEEDGTERTEFAHDADRVYDDPETVE